MKTLLVTILVTSSFFAHAKSNEKQLAIKTFNNFLKCSSRLKVSEKSFRKCVLQTLTKDSGTSIADQYSIIHRYGGTNSPLSSCDSDTRQLVEDFERPKPELYLCFQSQSFDGQKTGIVFFKTESGVPKISKIKW